MPIIDPAKKHDTMRIWNLASETDPTHTKEVTIGRKLTAIDSYYQIRRATEHFGPMGQGWGYEAEFSILEFCTPPLAVVTMRLWYVDPRDEAALDLANRVQCPPIRAMNKLASNDGKVDEEAFKKATTDALTKSLSYLGFSADVFMGLFDDQKYKTAMAAKFEKARATSQPIPDKIAMALAGLHKVTDLAVLETLFYGVFGNKTKGLPVMPELGACSPAQLEYIRLQFSKRKQELQPVEPDAQREDLAAAG